MGERTSATFSLPGTAGLVYGFMPKGSLTWMGQGAIYRSLCEEWGSVCRCPSVPVA